MSKVVLYAALGICLVPATVYLGVSLFVEGPAADSIAAGVLFLCAASFFIWAIRRGYVPDVRKTSFVQASLFLFCVIVVVSAACSGSVVEVFSSLAFDMTSALMLLLCAVLCWMLSALPDVPRRALLAVAGTLLILTISVPYVRTVPHVRPSLSMTTTIASSFFFEHGTRALLIGESPGAFVRAWQQYRPQSVNLTPFWSEDFSTGSGILPTLLIEIGLLGVFLLVVVFFASLAEATVDVITRWRTMARIERAASLLGPALLLVSITSLAFAEPSIAVVFLSFVVLGTCKQVSSPTRAPHFLVVRGTTIFFCISAAGVLYLLFSTILYVSAFSTAAIGDLPSARVRIQLAYGMDANSRTGRLYAQIFRAEARELSQHNATVDAVVPLFHGASLVAKDIAARDPYNAQNWKILGILMAERYAIKPDKELLQSGIEAFDQAMVRSPSDPSARFFAAQLYILARKRPEAKKLLDEALQLRPIYTEAKDLRVGLEGK